MVIYAHDCTLYYTAGTTDDTREILHEEKLDD